GWGRGWGGGGVGRGGGGPPWAWRRSAAWPSQRHPVCHRRSRKAWLARQAEWRSGRLVDRLNAFSFSVVVRRRAIANCLWITNTRVNKKLPVYNRHFLDWA